MPLACYCKKCKIEVPVGETCSRCGGKLTKASQRFSFQVMNTPLKDWMRWNSILRIVLSVWCVLTLIVLASECATYGWIGASRLVGSATGTALMLGLAAAVFAVSIYLWALGTEDHYYFFDSKGINVSIFVKDAGKIRRYARLVFKQVECDESYGWFAGQRQVQWSQIKRVQIWHDKCKIIVYSPSWWMQMSITCPADQFPEAVAYVIGKLGKKKDVSIQHTPEEMSYADQ